MALASSSRGPRCSALPAFSLAIVCGSVQVCWKKFARYWDVELREVEMEPGRLRLDPARMLERVDENTIIVVPPRRDLPWALRAYV